MKIAASYNSTSHHAVAAKLKVAVQWLNQPLAAVLLRGASIKV